jgi:hypothetical protein
MYVALYLVAIVAANLLTARFGPAASYFNAFALIGLDLVAKDKLQDAWQGRHLVVKMGALIATGSLLSYALNRNAGPIALASFVAFAAASATDGLVYQRLRTRTWMVRSNGSNIPGAAVDSIVFPTIAFGGLNPWITLGQFAAKVAGGLFWSFVIGRTRRESVVA